MQIIGGALRVKVSKKLGIVYFIIPCAFKMLVTGRFIPSILSYPRSLNSESGFATGAPLVSNSIFHWIPDVLVI